MTAAVLVPLAFLTINIYFPVSFLLHDLMIAIALVLVYVNEYLSPSSSSLSSLDQHTLGSGLPPIAASRTRSDPALIIIVSPTSLLSNSALGGAERNK